MARSSHRHSSILWISWVQYEYLYVSVSSLAFLLASMSHACSSPLRLRTSGHLLTTLRFLCTTNLIIQLQHSSTVTVVARQGTVESGTRGATVPLTTKHHPSCPRLSTPPRPGMPERTERGVQRPHPHPDPDLRQHRERRVRGPRMALRSSSSPE